MLDICMPCYKTVDIRTFISFFTLAMPNVNRSLFVEHSITGDIAAARNELVKRILASEAEYSLWLDSDVSFHSDALAKLVSGISTFADAAIVTGLTRGRTYPHDVVCMLRGEDGAYRGAFSHLKGNEIPTTLMEIDACGADFMLVRNRVFREFGCDFTRRDGITEDLSFCERVKENGWKIYAHGGVRIGHQAEVTLEV